MLFTLHFKLNDLSAISHQFDCTPNFFIMKALAFNPLKEFSRFPLDTHESAIAVFYSIPFSSSIRVPIFIVVGFDLARPGFTCLLKLKMSSVNKQSSLFVVTLNPCLKSQRILTTFFAVSFPNLESLTRLKIAYLTNFSRGCLLFSLTIERRQTSP